LPLCPDWRWFLESENSPWYRSLKLFRSKNITDDWNDIILEIKKELINTFH